MCQILSSLTSSINKTRTEHGAVLPNEMADKLLAARENGENEINEFVKQKIIENPSKFWEKISKVNILTFETLN